jgi:2-polyprenyl-3-methyl-5-hydroxy-6-metoxy-1,4-benzoquinol methylase
MSHVSSLTPAPRGFALRDACPLCDAPRDAAAVHIDFPDLPVLKCSRCGFIFPAATMTTEGIERYYRLVFASPWHRKGQQLNSFVNYAALWRLVDLRNIRTFLDVGCGYGFLLQRLQGSHGSAMSEIRAVGTEPSTQEAEWGNASLGVTIHNSLLSQANLPKNHFDVVACFEVIEHVPDPRAFVAELAEHAKPGGLVIINTDNFESAAVRTLGPRFAKWIPHSHISDFSPQTLRRCAAGAGLKIEGELSYTAWENALRALLSRFQKPRTPAECFNLQHELGREMARTYRFWPLRVAIARTWFALNARRNLEGSMMYLAARKPR